MHIHNANHSTSHPRLLVVLFDIELYVAQVIPHGDRITGDTTISKTARNEARHRTQYCTGSDQWGWAREKGRWHEQEEQQEAA